MQGIDLIFSAIVLIMSVVIHEVSHGYAAYLLGDRTARDAGRLTLNPIKHLDFFGSFLIPLATYISGGFIFGWAKPVPYNPYNLKDQKWGPALVGIAGPVSNLIVALIFGLGVRYGSATMAIYNPVFLLALKYIVAINILLAIFNLIPIPPLDGSKVLFGFLPSRLWSVEQTLERYGFIILIIFILFFFQYIFPVVSFLFKLITGTIL